MLLMYSHDLSDLMMYFNEAVDELMKFRNQHVILITTCMVNPAARCESHEVKNAVARDVAFLKSIRDQTIKIKI